jgi:hypothetical protein
MGRHISSTGNGIVTAYPYWLRRLIYLYPSGIMDSLCRVKDIKCVQLMYPYSSKVSDCTVAWC